MSRQKRSERRSTQAVTLDEISDKNKEEEQEDEPTKERAPPKLVVPNGPSDRQVPVTVSITDTGAVVWDNKKSPESDTPSPVNKESASDKAEVVRKKVARRKRDERRSTQHVSKDDLPPHPDNDEVNTAADMNSKEKEDHLAKVGWFRIQILYYTFLFTVHASYLDS